MSRELMITSTLRTYFKAVRERHPELADDNERKIYTGIEFAREWIRKMEPGPERAKAIQGFITAMYTPAVLEGISCKKGCSACCHVQPIIQRDEAKLLAQSVKRRGLKLDPDLLHEAGTFRGTKPEWDKKRKPCVLLGDDGACSVYEDRPQICRNHHVKSDPAICVDTERGKITIVINEWAEAVLSAYMNEDESGWLGKMLMEELEKYEPKFPN